jgi:hypothetical protein
MVLGSNIPLKNNQNVKYLRLNETERTKFEKKVVGVFVVLDKEEQFNQHTFLKALQNAVEMSDQTSQFLIKAF